MKKPKYRIEVSYVFADTVQTAEFTARKASIHAVSGDVLCIQMTGGKDQDGAVKTAIITPNSVTYRRPL